MDTGRYRRLLASLATQIRERGDANAARMTDKWLRECESLSDDPESRTELAQHVGRVKRTAYALATVSLQRSPAAVRTEESALMTLTLDDLLAEIDTLNRAFKREQEVLEDRGLEMIKGEFLSSVEFAMDSYGFTFDQGSLQVFTDPVVSSADRTFRLGEAGYRDALCGLIGNYVEGVSVENEKWIKVQFRDGEILTISLRAQDAVGPECVVYWSAAGGCWVW